MTEKHVKILKHIENYPFTNAEMIANILWKDTDTEIAQIARLYHNGCFSFRGAKLRAGQYMGRLVSKGWVKSNWDRCGCHSGYTITPAGKEALREHELS